MEPVDQIRQVVEQTLAEYASIPYASGDLTAEVVIDRDADRYLLLTVGWQAGRRVHNTLVHVDIIDGKVWIQRDGTEEGIARDFVRAGIPNDRIVLGFREPELRRYTDFAVA